MPRDVGQARSTKARGVVDDLVDRAVAEHPEALRRRQRVEQRRRPVIGARRSGGRRRRCAGMGSSPSERLVTPSIVGQRVVEDLAVGRRHRVERAGRRRVSRTCSATVRGEALERRRDASRGNRRRRPAGGCRGRRGGAGRRPGRGPGSPAASGRRARPAGRATEPSTRDLDLVALDGGVDRGLEAERRRQAGHELDAPPRDLGLDVDLGSSSTRLAPSARRRPAVVAAHGAVLGVAVGLRRRLGGARRRAARLRRGAPPRAGAAAPHRCVRRVAAGAVGAGGSTPSLRGRGGGPASGAPGPGAPGPAPGPRRARGRTGPARARRAPRTRPRRRPRRAGRGPAPWPPRPSSRRRLDPLHDPLRLAGRRRASRTGRARVGAGRAGSAALLAGVALRPRRRATGRASAAFAATASAGSWAASSASTSSARAAAPRRRRPFEPWSAVDLGSRGVALAGASSRLAWAKNPPPPPSCLAISRAARRPAGPGGRGTRRGRRSARVM